jgi:hypothetical protein
MLVEALVRAVVVEVAGELQGHVKVAYCYDLER